MRTLSKYTVALVAFLAPFVAHAATMTATLNTTNGQANGSFVLGAGIPTIIFGVTGEPANTATHITWTASKENGAIKGSGSIPITTDSGGNATTAPIPMPASILGYFRVDANLDDGTVLYPVGKEQGTRPPGFITYAVMNNPDAKYHYQSSLSRFGLEDILSGGSSNSTVPSSTLAYLGIDFVAYIEQQWVQLEPNGPNTFSGTLPISYWNTTAATTPTGAPWKTYEIFYFTATHTPGWAKGSPCGSGNNSDFCTLNSTGAAELPSFAQRYAAAAKAQYPAQDRYYQITWEAIDLGGSYANLLQYYQLVYAGIHAGDPQAIVVGPADFISSENVLINMNNAGNPPYSAVVDGTSMHNYTNVPPESGVGYWDHTFPTTPNNIPSGLTLIRGMHDYQSIMRGFKGFDIPLIGTEGGYKSEQMGIPNYNRTVRASVDASLLLHAQSSVRKTIIWLGEGGKLDTLFKVADFWFTTPTTDPGSTWGVYFNLDATAPGHGNYGSRFLGPKPAAPAYSAMAWFLDGFSSANGPVPGLTGTQVGYSFTHVIPTGHQTLALWDWGTSSSMANVAVPAGPYKQCGMMGNCTDFTSNGTVAVTLTGAPLYLVTGGTGGGGPPPGVPTNSTVPAIAGSATVGSTLTVDNGAWTNSPTSYRYTWSWEDFGTSSFHGNTFVVRSADVGHKLGVTEIATNAAGDSAPVRTALTATVTNQTPAVPVNQTPPTISGSATVGSTLTSDPGTWTNNPTSYAYTWSWEDFGSSPFHNTTFVVRSADVGHKLGVTVTATNPTGPSTPPTRSALTATVQ